MFSNLPKNKNLCHFNIFVNTGPYGSGNFKPVPLQVLSDLGENVFKIEWSREYKYLPKLNILWYFKIFVNTGSYVLEISKCYSHWGFHLNLAQLHEDIGDHSGMQSVTFLGNQSSFLKTIWHFEILRWESMR